MMWRVDQECRYLAIPKRCKSILDRSVLFRARQIENAYRGLSESALHVARHGLKLRRVRRKKGSCFVQCIRLSPDDQSFGLSNGRHPTPPTTLYALFRAARKT